ncbi:NfeD family protein [Halomonas binhaiensis]|uniref:Nodulation efficiency, NfeD-like protein n=1 Tax=Halomonas binhaiensis TaxID=2562282 RepID=A0A5C1NIU1_9GAMM|nr:NfeD family protein [Halomonas binhaiensis]QEM83246.1 nodulation efficiency, NfeD-like protein [Halomonas binhaiensis]
MDLLNPALLWLLLALAILVIELLTGSYVLLAISLAAGLTAAAAWLGLSLASQLIVMALGCGILVPLAIRRLRKRQSKSTFGVAGTGSNTGQRFVVTQRDYDGAACIKLDGDFYRAVLETSEEPELTPGDPVMLVRFDGTQAIVKRSH